VGHVAAPSSPPRLPQRASFLLPLPAPMMQGHVLMARLRVGAFAAADAPRKDADASEHAVRVAEVPPGSSVPQGSLLRALPKCSCHAFTRVPRSDVREYVLPRFKTHRFRATTRATENARLPAPAPPRHEQARQHAASAGSACRYAYRAAILCAAERLPPCTNPDPRSRTAGAVRLRRCCLPE